ncbi:MAG: hypothetical protein QM770_01130 [Tepidisphaeraceae bacterium]
MTTDRVLDYWGEVPVVAATEAEAMKIANEMDTARIEWHEIEERHYGGAIQPLSRLPRKRRPDLSREIEERKAEHEKPSLGLFDVRLEMFEFIEISRYVYAGSRQAACERAERRGWSYGLGRLDVTRVIVRFATRRQDKPLRNISGNDSEEVPF